MHKKEKKKGVGISNCNASQEIHFNPLASIKWEKIY